MRRRIVKPCVYLLLGAIINIAVAWGCASNEWPSPVTEANFQSVYDAHLAGHHSREAHADEMAMLSQAGWAPRKSTDRFIYGADISVTERPGMSRVDYSATAKSRQPRIDACSWGMKHHDERLFSTVQAGWPARSMSGERWRVYERDAGGDVVLAEESPGVGRFRNVASFTVQRKIMILGSPTQCEILVPLRPIWHGFALNATIYAVTLFAITAIAGWSRRTWRRHRGRCGACGYDLRGQPPPESSEPKTCPECGESVIPANGLYALFGAC